ncbi:MAG: hypothetical protein C0594_15105 [Marinilabiliales bacterium]|nr:MAG: hypothetical protein C0594_15105 [Marinilabiliales bacterium]
MNSIINRLYQNNFIDQSNIEGELIYHLKTPCIFIFSADIVADLRKQYISDEEIGGVFWAQPSFENGSRVFKINNISYVRNAIEDNPRRDNLTRKNSYFPDSMFLNKILEDIFNSNCLPIRFHTHPTKDKDPISSLSKGTFNLETSDADINASSIAYKLDSEKLLLPRALIVGNTLLSNDIFIGLYNGFITPTSFAESKKEIQNLNMERSFSKISDIEFSTGQTIGLILGAGLLLYAIAKYPKFSIPAIASIGLLVANYTINTDKIDNPNFFNKLSGGKAVINIPKVS